MNKKNKKIFDDGVMFVAFKTTIPHIPNVINVKNKNLAKWNIFQLKIMKMIDLFVLFVTIPKIMLLIKIAIIVRNKKRIMFNFIPYYTKCTHGNASVVFPITLEKKNVINVKPINLITFNIFQNLIWMNFKITII